MYVEARRDTNYHGRFRPKREAWATQNGIFRPATVDDIPAILLLNRQWKKEADDGKIPQAHADSALKADALAKKIELESIFTIEDETPNRSIIAVGGLFYYIADPHSLSYRGPDGREAYVGSHYHESGFGVMYGLLVNQSQRGKGYGIRLIEALEEEARRHGFFEIQLNAYPHVVSLYEGQRYTRLFSYPDIDTQCELVRMAKRL